MSQSKKDFANKKSLIDSDIVTQETVGRRRALSTIGGVAAGTAALVTGRRSYASHVTDNDTNSFSDPGGRGRRNDFDGGANADPGGGGTDNDGFADPAGGGETGVTDRDSGPNEDPVAHGGHRGGRVSDPAGQSRLNDRDAGKFADPGRSDSD